MFQEKNSEERAKEVTNISKQQDAGRARSAKAVLANNEKPMQKYDLSPYANNEVQ